MRDTATLLLKRRKKVYTKKRLGKKKSRRRRPIQKPVVINENSQNGYACKLERKIWRKAFSWWVQQSVHCQVTVWCQLLPLSCSISINCSFFHLNSASSWFNCSVWRYVKQTSWVMFLTNLSHTPTSSVFVYVFAIWICLHKCTCIYIHSFS